MRIGLWDPQDNIEQNNVCIIGVEEEKQKEEKNI